MKFFEAYHALLDSVMINCILGLSQYVVMRAGIFSLATTGLAALGGYCAGFLVLRAGVPLPVAWLAGVMLGVLVGAFLSWPLARLRGVFQAIATISLVQLVQSLIYWAEPITGGAGGLNGIPPAAQTPVIALWLIIVLIGLAAIGSSDIGRAFDTIREDETLAATLGIKVSRYHLLAFALSGGIAASGGILLGFHHYSLMPDAFGFDMVTNVLAYVVLGGINSAAGALTGAVVLTGLPEIARPLADQRTIAVGILLMACIIYLPDGLVDTLRHKLRARRIAKVQRGASGVSSEEVADVS